MKHSELIPRFVKFMPEEKEEGILYISLEFGTALDQAIAQLEVLREEYAERILHTTGVSREDMVWSEINAITGGNEQEWREECRPSLSEIMQVEQLKRMLQE